MKLAIFPGHVGKDAGAIDREGPATEDKLYSVESVVTWGIASKMSTLCKLLGVEHRLCFGSFTARLAESQDCTVGVSIHADALPDDPRVHGFHCLYYPHSAKGKALALRIEQELDTRHHKSRPAHPRGHLAILRDTPFPCVLVESGFLTNAEEEALLMDNEYQYNLAWALVAGARRFMFLDNNSVI